MNWCDWALKNRSAWTGGTFIGQPYKIVLHTTESKNFYPGTKYYGHTNFPHFTIRLKEGRYQVYQHIAIDHAARALRNSSGGVQTNRANAIQIEIAWKAAEAPQMPQELLDGVARTVEWVRDQVPVGNDSVPFMVYPDSYGDNGIRLSGQEWYRFSGICGHQHVPENTHGDPGLIRLETNEDMLRNGDYGNTVQEWQENLIAYFKANGTTALPKYGADKDFGDETTEWTKKWQQEVGLTPDGNVDLLDAARMEAYLRVRTGNGEKFDPKGTYTIEIKEKTA